MPYAAFYYSLRLYGEGDAMPSILQITDNTTTFDLLNITDADLISWDYQVAQPKSNNMVDLPNSDGQFPVADNYQSNVQTFKLAIVGDNQDAVIAKLNRLVVLLKAAHEHFVDKFNYTPVYLVFKPTSATNTQYAIITKFSIPNLNNILFNYFVTGGIHNGINYAAVLKVELFIEHLNWQDNLLYSPDGVTLSQSYTFNSLTYGPSSVTSVPVANKTNVANITHIYRYVGGAWSANLISATLPYEILPNTVAANDFIVFGISTAVTDDGPFNSLVFDIGTAASGIDGQWESYRGGGTPWYYWNSLGGNDGTNNFENTGVRLVTCNLPTQDVPVWITGNLNTIFGGSAPSVTGWWVRYLVTSASSVTAPTQQNRRVYTVTKPYVDIAAADNSGDLDGMLDMTLTRCEIGTNGFSGVMIGSRALSRGSNFTPFITFSQSQLPSGVSFPVTNNVTFSSSSIFQNGDVLSFDNGTQVSGSVVVQLSGDLSKEYTGRFRVMLRLYHNSTSSFYSISISAASAASGTGLFWTGPTLYPPGGVDTLLDFGSVTISPELNPTGSYDLTTSFLISIIGEDVDVEPFYLYDLILFPEDEMFMTFTNSISPIAGNVNFLDNGEIMDIYSDYKSGTVATHRSGTTIEGSYYSLGSGLKLKPGIDQRIFFLTYYSYDFSAGSAFRASSNNLMNVTISKQSQYLTLRGSA